MRCPFCNNELKLDVNREFETTSEHCFDPNNENDIYLLRPTYVCDCELSQDSFWNQDGGFYTRNFNSDRREQFQFSSAIDSLDRQLDIECYKHDEDHKIFKIFGWQLWIRYSYESNYHGDIVSRKSRLEWIKPDGTLYISGMHMFIYCVKRHFNCKAFNNEYFKNELRDNFKYPQYDFQKSDWWRWVVPFVLRIIDHGFYKKIAS